MARTGTTGPARWTTGCSKTSRILLLFKVDIPALEYIIPIVCIKTHSAGARGQVSPRKLPPPLPGSFHQSKFKILHSPDCRIFPASRGLNRLFPLGVSTVLSPRIAHFRQSFCFSLFLLRFLCGLLFKSFGCGSAVLRLGPDSESGLKGPYPCPSASIRGSILSGRECQKPRIGGLSNEGQ